MHPQWQIYLGDEAVGRSGGYATPEAARAAARRLADLHGSLPLEVRPLNHVPRVEDDGASQQ